MGEPRSNNMRVSLALVALLVASCAAYDIDTQEAAPRRQLLGRGNAKVKDAMAKMKEKIQKKKAALAAGKPAGDELIETTEWVESAKASLADKFELAAGKAQHFELAEDEEWHALMQDWKKDLNGMPQEQLVEAGWFGSMFGGKKSAPKTKTISMDMDAAAAGGLASASLCVQAGVPSYMPTKMLGSGMQKIFDSMVLKKLAQSGLNLQPDEDTALIAEAPCDTKENNKQLFTFGTPNIPFVGKLSLTVLGSADLTGLDAIKNMAKSFGR